MTPFVRLQIRYKMAEAGPQADYDLWELLRELRTQGAAPDTLRDVWKLMGVETRVYGPKLCATLQNLNACMNGIARDIGEERLGLVELGDAVREWLADA